MALRWGALPDSLGQNSAQGLSVEQERRWEAVARPFPRLCVDMLTV